MTASNITNKTVNKPKLNITEIITDLIREISVFTESFSHIDANRILVCLASNKSRSRGGIYGKLVPLKFKNGSDILVHKGRKYKIPEIINKDFSVLYAVYFYIPKFFDLSASEKLNTIFHELYHISSDFNGDIRRLGKVKQAHGFSKKKFDTRFENDYKSFLEFIKNKNIYNFLEMDSKTLHNNFIIYARRMKLPKPVLVY
jgi:hypothetical protein